MCNPFFQLITNSMMYGGGYMTGSGMETTSMLFSGVNSIFNCGCGYGGYGNYGYGDSSYNQNTMLGWAAGIIGFNVAGMLVNKGIQNHRENVATRQAQTAADMTAFKNALKTLGLENVAIETLDDDALRAKVAVTDAERAKFQKPVKAADEKIQELNTKDADLAAVDAGLAQVGHPTGQSGATTIEGYIAEWEAAKTDETNYKGQAGVIQEKINKLNELKTLRDAWADPNGTKFKALEQAKQDKEAAVTKAKNDEEALVAKRQEAYDVAYPLLMKMKSVVSNQNDVEADEADGCWLSRWGGHNLMKNGEFLDGEIDTNSLNETDLRQLLYNYRKGTLDKKNKITQYLKDNPEIAQQLLHIAPSDKKDILNKIIYGTALS